MPSRPISCSLPKLSVRDLATRRHGHLDLLAVAQDHHRQRHLRCLTDDPLNVLEALDLVAVDSQELVACHEARSLGRRVGLYVADHGGREGLADEGEEPGQEKDGEEEVGQGAGGHDPAALAQALGRKGHRPLLGRHLCDRRVGHARGIDVAEHLHIAAERYETEFPACLGPIGPSEDLRAEADGKDFDADPVAARHEVVAHLMDEDQDGQNDQKGGNGNWECVEQDLLH